ncbi:hypothetical protein FAI41_02525 [Acetobacteraceae bacterium]|nr:hypothetical protein FAI41_02525 [Acetobacteraceae bacterium]
MTKDKCNLENDIEGFSPDLSGEQKKSLFKTLKQLAPEILVDGRISLDRLASLLEIHPSIHPSKHSMNIMH